MKVEQKMVRIPEDDFRLLDKYFEEGWSIASISATSCYHTREDDMWAMCYVLLERDKTSKDNKPKAKRRPNKVTVANVDLVLIPKPYQNSMLKWIKYKDERNENYVQSGLKAHISKMVKEYPEVENYDKAVEFSMANNYKGVFAPPKGYVAPNKKGSVTQLSINDEVKPFENRIDGW